jgi:hypothetical protein
MLVATALPAHADDAAEADELRAKGEAAAKARRYTDAIDAFKGADRLAPSARNACLIALAYARREVWPQAEVYLAVCHERVTPADPLPAWVDKEGADIAARIAAANLVAVTFVADPGELLTVSSFLPDETFTARTVHLAAGDYVVAAHGASGAEIKKTFHVSDGQPMRVEMTAPRVEPQPQPLPLPLPLPQPLPLPLPPPVTVAHSHALSYAIGGAGVAFLAGGLVYQETEFASINTSLTKAGTGQKWDKLASTWDFREHVTQALYGVGAAALLTGVVLHFTLERSAAITVESRPGGGVVSLAWAR